MSVPFGVVRLGESASAAAPGSFGVDFTVAVGDCATATGLVIPFRDHCEFADERYECDGERFLPDEPLRGRVREAVVAELDRMRLNESSIVRLDLASWGFRDEAVRLTPRGGRPRTPKLVFAAQAALLADRLPGRSKRAVERMIEDEFRIPRSTVQGWWRRLGPEGGGYLDAGGELTVISRELLEADGRDVGEIVRLSLRGEIRA